MYSAPGAKAGRKAVYALSCIFASVVLVVSGYAYYVKAQVSSIGGSDAISSSGPQTGAMNILLMGLESRTDYDGNILPADLLYALHAGSVQGVENGVGGQDTNTLILIHIFAGGQKAVGFSIPRDDWVTFPQPYDGQSAGKIDQAYGLAWAQSLQATANSSMSRDQRYLEANEAGQAATIATVTAVTGQHVDHFAEVNLAGFYELAKSFGGVEACLRSWDGPNGPGTNLHDTNSGFNAPRAGYLHLDAEQALAFVRERDNLPNGDLDRTHRQQAVIDYAVWKVKNEGVFTSLGQLTSLLDVAKQYLITDSHFNLLDFASDMHALSGSNLTFRTAPVVTDDGQIDNQTVNIINIPYIKQVIKEGFYPPPAQKKPATMKSPTDSVTYPPSETTVDVYNGGNTGGLAGLLSQALTSVGYKSGKVSNIAARASTEVLYGTGAEASAEKIANAFSGVPATASSSVAAGHVEVLLGADATSVPSGVGTASSSSSSSSSGPSSSESDGSNGGAVIVKGNAPYGIPCVY